MAMIIKEPKGRLEGTSGEGKRIKKSFSQRLGSWGPFKKLNEFADGALRTIGIEPTPLKKNLAMFFFTLVFVGWQLFVNFEAFQRVWYHISPGVEIKIKGGPHYVNRVIHFEAKSKKELDYDWNWDFGDSAGLINSTEQARLDTHTYIIPGNYWVSLSHEDKPRRYKTKKLVTIQQELSKEQPDDSIKLNPRDTFYYDIKLPESGTVTIYRWYFEKVVITTDNKTGQRKYDIIEVRDMKDFPGYQWDQPGNYDVLLETVDESGIQQTYEYKVEVDGEHTSKIEPEPEPEPEEELHRIIYTSYTRLSQDLTVLANRGTSHPDKRVIVNRIKQDAASIKISVNSSTLEDYLKKIQLEASSTRVTITVTNIRRNAQNRIIAISTKQN